MVFEKVKKHCEETSRKLNESFEENLEKLKENLARNVEETTFRKIFGLNYEKKILHSFKKI